MIIVQDRDQSEELEEYVAAMAPEEPDIFVLYDAIKLIEYSFQLSLDIKISHKSKIQRNTVLRRIVVEERCRTYFNMAINDGSYVNWVQVSADRYRIIYSNFVAAAYGFCNMFPSLKYRGQRTEGE